MEKQYHSLNLVLIMFMPWACHHIHCKLNSSQKPIPLAPIIWATSDSSNFHYGIIRQPNTHPDYTNLIITKFGIVITGLLIYCSVIWYRSELGARGRRGNKNDYRNKKKSTQSCFLYDSPSVSKYIFFFLRFDKSVICPPKCSRWLMSGCK